MPRDIDMDDRIDNSSTKHYIIYTIKHILTILTIVRIDRFECTERKIVDGAQR